MKENFTPDYSYETAALNSGFSLVCGVDEAGRGPLAGPVFAAAVILPKECPVIDGLNDSKKLSEKKREALFDIIIEKAVAYKIASASVDEIEEFNILNATFLAMKRAVEGLPVAADYAIIDGNRLPQMNIACSPLIKGDAKSLSVAAASILAKVARDRYITELDDKYP
ncbi:MAG: ribonuclease HII, partial [Clostridia bacterium]|nr:ribonuclease HII [Clostridia bacterium]